MPRSPHESFTALLRDVSRSFYLTLRVLPADVRSQIGLAYLLARTTDTIADTDVLPVSRRLEALEDLRARILGESERGAEFGQLAQNQALPAERILLQRIDDMMGLLLQFPAADKEKIRAVLRIIISGQKLDLERFGSASVEQIVALPDDEAAEDYTYRVAGCVGEFWTRICRAHLFPSARVDEPFLLSNSVRFGKGLQWVNILRDLPRDLRTGRCYLPREKLATAGLSPAELLDPSNEKRLRPVYDSYLDRAEAHLVAGWEYILALPKNQKRVRLACAWPVLIGVRTIARLRRENFLDPDRRVKVSRWEIYGIMVRTILLLPFPGLWKGQFVPTKRRQGNAVDSPKAFLY